MASKDGSTSSDPTGDAAVRPPQRRARTAAEQRHEQGATSNDPEVLAAEIEKTREELAETLDAIADKVSPKRVAGRTKKKVGSAVKDGAEGAAASVKAGATQLKGAVQDKKEALQEKAGSDDGLEEALESVGQDPDATVGTLAAPGTGGSVRTTSAAPGLHPVPAEPGYASPSGSDFRLGPPALAGAVAALAVALFVLRRRRRSRSRWL